MPRTRLQRAGRAFGKRFRAVRSKWHTVKPYAAPLAGSAVDLFLARRNIGYAASAVRMKKAMNATGALRHALNAMTAMHSAAAAVGTAGGVRMLYRGVRGKGMPVKKPAGSRKGHRFYGNQYVKLASQKARQVVQKVKRFGQRHPTAPYVAASAIGAAAIIGTMGLGMRGYRGYRPPGRIRGLLNAGARRWPR